MVRIGVIAALLSLATPAWARPGFYIGLGAGTSTVSGETGMGESRFGKDEFGLPLILAPGFTLNTDNDGGTAALFRLGFNILGYAAIEAVASGHGTELTDEDLRQWAAHAHLGARAYPLWHWQNRLPELLQPLEPSIFLGWGVSYQAYVPVPGADPVGWEDWGSMRFGLGLEYFLIEYFKVGIDWNWIHASYGKFIYNQDEGIHFPVEPPATTNYHQVFATIGFQFGAEQRQVRYAPEPAPTMPAPEPAPVAPAPEPTPEPAPVPEPTPIIDG
jgi:hypothetical protein